MKYLDISTWKRKKHFHFFRQYENPFFNICARINIANLYHHTKKNNISLFASYLYLSLKTANSIEEFHYRLQQDQVIVHDTIHAGWTTLQPDETFSFCYVNYDDNFCVFSKEIQQELDRKKGLDAAENRDDLIYYSIIPWVHFTGLTHAHRIPAIDSVPRITFGKYMHEGNHVYLPVSVEVHHALMDGLQVGKFFECFSSAVESVNL